MNALSWTTLRGISQSSLGKFSILLPFLPFVIDFLSSVLKPIQKISDFAIYIAPVADWIEKNQSSVIILYIGIFIFVISKVLFDLFAPEYVKKYEDLANLRRELLEEKKIALDVDEKEYANFLSKRLSNSSIETTSAENEREMLRYIISILFLVSISLLLFPPIKKFVVIFFEFIF